MHKNILMTSLILTCQWAHVDVFFFFKKTTPAHLWVTLDFTKKNKTQTKNTQTPNNSLWITHSVLSWMIWIHNSRPNRKRLGDNLNQYANNHHRLTLLVFQNLSKSNTIEIKNFSSLSQFLWNPLSLISLLF